MKIISKLPVHIDYILGILMLLAATYMIYSWGLILYKYNISFLEINSLFPYVWLFISGIVLMLLPHKNLRRSIWLCALILCGDLLLLGNVEYTDFKGLYGVVGFNPNDEIFIYAVKILSIGLVHIGCGIAVLINSTMFALKKVRSIYPMIIAVILSIMADYAMVMANKAFTGGELDVAGSFIRVYIPHMALYGVFALLFTSDEVSWYTSKGEMYRVLNRLKTTNNTFSLHFLTRDQAIVLMQCTSDCSIRLRHGRFSGTLEVRCHDGIKDLVFCRSGTASLTGALYEYDVKFVLPDTLSKSRYLEIYSASGDHLRMELSEPRVKHVKRKVAKTRIEYGLVPKMCYNVTNASLYHIVEGDGEVDLRRSYGMRKSDYTLSVTHDETGRSAVFSCTDGTFTSTMPVRAIVPVNEYGAFTKLYIYGDMGEFMAFRISAPKRKQAEKPDTD